MALNIFTRRRHPTMQQHLLHDAGTASKARRFATRTLMLLGLFLLTSCLGSPSKTQVDVVVSSPADVETVARIQRERSATPESVAGNPGYQVIEGVAVEKLPEYRLGTGDILEIVYHILYEKNLETYKFEVQDKVNVIFPFHPQFSSTVMVRSDGKVSLPLLGDVMVESLTPMDLTKLLNQMYSKYIINPNVTVSLQEFNVKIEELKRAITTAPRGQSKIAPIAPDGRVSLPIIGNIQAAGLTVRELEKMINERYANYVRNLQTTLIINEIHHMRCYVLGEVDKPGEYEMAGQPTLFDAIAKAGGYKTGADLADVVILRSQGLQKPMVMKVDLQKSLDSGVVYAGLSVQPADVIYVPKTKLDTADDMIAKIFTKGIYSILPFTSSFTVNYDLSNTYTIK
jgi:polysaccharide export outer membrane protein